MRYFSTDADIICDSGAASMIDCHVLVDIGITKPNSKNHSSRHRPLNKTFWKNKPFVTERTQPQTHPTCSSRNFSIGSFELKLNSLETARHFKIFFGTLASCSTSETERSSAPCQKTFPPSASLKHIQLLIKSS